LSVCKEHASAKKRLFPNEPVEPAAQLLLDSPGAAQILRAYDILLLFLILVGKSRCDVPARAERAE
jgi:hypothetical protein